MDDSKQRKMGAILSYVSIIVNTLIQFLYTPFLVKMLGQAEYGLYSLVSSIIGYLTILDLGFGNAIIVYTAKYRATNNKEAEEKLHGMFKIVFYIIGLIAIILGIILYFNVENIFNKTMSIEELEKAKVMMLILTFNLGITFAFSIYPSIISAYEKFTFQKITAILGSLLKPLIMIPLLLIGYKSITMTIVITIINVVILISNYVYCRKKLKLKIKYRGFDKIVFKTVIGYSVWIFLSIIVDKVNWSVDQFVLGAISGTVAVAIYSIASQFNNLIINLATAISNVFLPKMSKMVAEKKNVKELSDEWIKVGRIQFLLIFLFLTGFIIFGKAFIKSWVGDGFEESYYVTLCLICPAIFSLIQNIGLSIMQAMNRFKFKAISTAIMSIFNVIISIFLAKEYGAVGAALGTTISLIICNVIAMNIYYYKIIKLDVIRFWKNIFIMFLKLLLPTLLTYMCIKYINLDSTLKIVLLGITYITIYSMISYLFVINDYEKELFKSIIRKVKGKVK